MSEKILADVQVCSVTSCLSVCIYDGFSITLAFASELIVESAMENLVRDRPSIYTLGLRVLPDGGCDH